MSNEINDALESRLREIIGLTDKRCSSLWEVIDGEIPLSSTKEVDGLKNEYIAPFMAFKQEHDPAPFLKDSTLQQHAATLRFCLRCSLYVHTQAEMTRFEAEYGGDESKSPASLDCYRLFADAILEHCLQMTELMLKQMPPLPGEFSRENLQSSLGAWSKSIQDEDAATYIRDVIAYLSEFLEQSQGLEEKKEGEA